MLEDKTNLKGSADSKAAILYKHASACPSADVACAWSFVTLAVIYTITWRECYLLTACRTASLGVCRRHRPSSCREVYIVLDRRFAGWPNSYLADERRRAARVTCVSVCRHVVVAIKLMSPSASEQVASLWEWPVLQYGARAPMYVYYLCLLVNGG